MNGGKGRGREGRGGHGKAEGWVDRQWGGDMDGKVEAWSFPKELTFTCPCRSWHGIVSNFSLISGYVYWFN